MKVADTFDLTQFKQISFIGNGSFGEVYKVEDTKSGELLAAKVSLRFLSESTDQSFRDLKREVDILSRTCHPSILRFVGFSPLNFHGEEKPVIITEFLANGSLFDIIELEKKGLSNSAWNDTRKLICIYGIASAMSYLHSNGIIHRDLKPANILMDDFLCPKIADFGLSKMNHQNKESMTADSTTMIKGTALYIAPEIWTDMEYSPACDVYSFAIIVYEIMTCQEPWKNLNMLQIHNKVESGFRPEIKGIPDSYKNLIEKCWVQNPDERPSFDEIIEELESDEGFITELVEKDDFLDYIDFLSNCKTEFGKNPIKIDQYIKRTSATFTKVTLDLKKSSSNIKIKETVKVSESKEKSKSKRFSLFKKSKPKMIYPSQEFHNLKISNQKLVEDSIGDPEKEFIIGQNLIEGKDDFPQKTEIGLQYLEHSVKGGSIDGTIYYCRLLIKGDVIPPDIEKASKLIKKLKKSNNGSVLVIQGKIKKKKNEHTKAIKYFQKSSKLGNAEGMYEYGKMLNKGLGCSVNKKEAKRYFEMAKKNGFDKCEKYLDAKGYFKKIADQGGAEELYQFAEMLYKGEEIDEDKNEAFIYYKKASDKGHTDSIFRCISMLENGEGVTKNKTQALKMCKKEADKGNSDAMLKYATMIGEGDESIEYYKKAADTNNVEAMHRYGLMLEHGKGVKMNKKEASKYYKKGAQKGDVDCMALYAKLGRRNEAFDNDPKATIQYAKQSADKSNPLGLCIYGKLIEDGKITGLDKYDAPPYIKKAADKGVADAKLIYGEFIKNGIVTSATNEEMERYFKEAIQLLKIEISEGNGDAMSNYAYMLFYGYGTPVDKKESCKYSKMAAEKGSIIGLTNYGADIFNGSGIAQNKKEGLRLIKMAAEKGNTFAMSKYADKLYDGEGIEENKREAVRWYKKAADLDHTYSIYCYAFCLYHGSGIEKDIKESVRLMKIAADKGNEDAMNFYGFTLKEGYGVSADIITALRYIKKSADRGCVNAMLAYGHALRDGDGVPVNKKEAERFYKMAADKDNVEAMFNYGVLLHNNNQSPSRDKEAVRYLKMAADKDHDIAMFNYAVLLYNGWGAPVNKKEAFKYAKMAADKGYKDAINGVANMLEAGDGVQKNLQEAARYRKMLDDK